MLNEDPTHSTQQWSCTNKADIGLGSEASWRYRDAIYFFSRNNDTPILIPKKFIVG